MSSLFIKYANFLFTIKVKKSTESLLLFHTTCSEVKHTIVLKMNQQECFVLNPGFHKKGRTYRCEDINTRQALELFIYENVFLRCENMVIIIFFI